jgi:hypothetical protein
MLNAVLSRSEVQEMVRTAGLVDYAELVLAAVRPGWALDPHPEGDPSRPGADKIGGDPDLTADERWPVSARGARMVFLAQIDCARLPEFPLDWPDPLPWPHGGQLLRIFANLLEERGAPCSARALSTDPATVLVRTAPPPIPEALAGAPYAALDIVEQYGRLAECAVRPAAVLTVPEVLPGLVDDRWEMSERAERYAHFSDQLRLVGVTRPPRWGTHIHHLLGEACSMQDDVREMPALLAEDHDAARLWEITPDLSLGTPDAWRTLLALHDDDRIGLEIGDAGAFHVMVPAADLAHNRLGRLMCDQASC